jgi:Mrp family chromosome partitioning ATPase
MTRIYNALKTQDGPLRPSDEEVAAHDVSQCQESSAKLGVNGHSPRRHRLLPMPPLTREARDQVVSLVDRVFLFTNSSSPRVVVFSNVEKGNSSSAICLHAAQILAARVSGEVCLVNANGEESLLHRSGPKEGFPGLADAIESSTPIRTFAVQTGSNLWFLPAGSRRDSSYRYSSDRLRGRMMELRKQFDYILIEAPSASAATTILLGQIADGVVMVVEAHSTRRETARIAKDTLEGAHVTLLGAVLNNRTFPIPEALYRKL